MPLHSPITPQPFTWSTGPSPSDLPPWDSHFQTQCPRALARLLLTPFCSPCSQPALPSSDLHTVDLFIIRTRYGHLPRTLLQMARSTLDHLQWPVYVTRFPLDIEFFKAMATFYLFLGSPALGMTIQFGRAGVGGAWVERRLSWWLRW